MRDAVVCVQRIIDCSAVELARSDVMADSKQDLAHLVESILPKNIIVRSAQVRSRGAVYICQSLKVSHENLELCIMTHDLGLPRDTLSRYAP